MKKNFLLVAIVVLAVALLISFFSYRAVNEFNHRDGDYANFFVYWLSGKLILNGGSPYNPAQWLAGHQANGFNEPLEPIFLYPLPLAVFLIPFGFFSYLSAFLAWKIVTQVLIAVSLVILLFHMGNTAQRRLFLPLMVASLYFGPVVLLLRTGSLSAIVLLAVCAVIILFDRKRQVFAGVLLASLLLKPSQGGTILLLLGIWFFARKDWKVLWGIVVGGVLLWLLGALIDLNWVSKFLYGGEAAFDRRLGLQSNVWSLAYIACAQNMTCTYLWGGGCAILLVVCCGLYLCKYHASLSIWETLNWVIPISFLSTVYLWEYDQTLYLIPITWISSTLVRKTKRYWPAFIFLLVVVFFSLQALFTMFRTPDNPSDLWSLGNTLLVLGGLFLTYRIKERITQ